MNLIEKMKDAYMHGEDMPLKGHVRLVLEDVRDGSQIVEEGDNLITNAVASIFSKNWCGLANFAGIMPLKQMYGGCLMFQNAITADADNFNPPNDLVNPLIAHAGDAPLEQTWTGKKRGTPVFSDYVETDTSIKQVWLWDNTQGNGTISTVCLCPSVLGNMGLTPSQPMFNPMLAFGGDRNSDTAFTENISKEYPWSIDEDGKIAKTIWIDGTTFKEYTIRHDYLAHGIMRSPRVWNDVAVRTATIRVVDNACIVFDDNDFYYVVKATSSTALRVDKISKTTFDVTQADMTFSGVSLYVGNMQGMILKMRQFAFDGIYLYYPNGDLNTFYKLNLSDNSDVTQLDGSITVHRGRYATGNGSQFTEPIVISEGLILGDNYIINGNSVYGIAQCKNILNQANQYTGGDDWLWLWKVGASLYGNGKQTYSSSSCWAGQGNATDRMFLSTIYNLDTPKTKGASQTMRLEYTLTEQT